MRANGQLALIALLVPLVGCQPGNRAAPAEHSTVNVDTVEERWPSGGLKLRKQVLHNPDGTVVDHGIYTRWYDNGRKEYETTFVHGRKHGTATRWHKNGQKWTEEHYVHGKKHGVCRMWYESGAQSKEEQYADGKPHGTWTVWNKDGRIKWQGSFKDGVPQPRATRPPPD